MATNSDIDERRRHPRVRILNLFSYVTKEGDKQTTAVSIGRALDVSASGMRLELHQQVNPGSAMELEIAIEEELFNVTGKVIHVHETSPGVHVAGVRFDDVYADVNEKFNASLQSDS